MGFVLDIIGRFLVRPGAWVASESRPKFRILCVAVNALCALLLLFLSYLLIADAATKTNSFLAFAMVIVVYVLAAIAAFKVSYGDAPLSLRDAVASTRLTWVSIGAAVAGFGIAATALQLIAPTAAEETEPLLIQETVIETNENVGTLLSRMEAADLDLQSYQDAIEGRWGEVGTNCEWVWQFEVRNGASKDILIAELVEHPTGYDGYRLTAEIVGLDNGTLVYVGREPDEARGETARLRLEPDLGRLHWDDLSTVAGEDEYQKC